jgi:hypothetical protein
LVAHRRAGKTVACVNDLINVAVWTQKQNARYGYIAPFYSQAKQVAWTYLKNYAARFLAEEPRESDLSVKLVTGATIRLYGADNPNSLRGMYFDGVILDEYADMKGSTWSEVLRPTLSDRHGFAVFIGTPKGKNAFWDIWETSKREPEWFSLELRASRTAILPESELRDARRMMTQDQYDQEFECSFDAAITGAVYGRWIREAADAGRVGVVPYDDRLPVNTAWDLGFDDSTAIWFFQVAHNEVRLIDFYEKNGEGIVHYCDVIKAKGYEYGRHWVPHDAANALMAAGGRSIVQQAWAEGVRMTVIPATSQMNSIEAARKTLEVCWFDEKGSGRGLESLRQYQFEYDEDKKTYKNKPRHDWSSHASDAFEIIGQVWQNPKNQSEKPPSRFLSETTANEVFWPKTPSPTRKDRI